MRAICLVHMPRILISLPLLPRSPPCASKGFHAMGSLHIDPLYRPRGAGAFAKARIKTKPDSIPLSRRPAALRHLWSGIQPPGSTWRGISRRMHRPLPRRTPDPAPIGLRASSFCRARRAGPYPRRSLCTQTGGAASREDLIERLPERAVADGNCECRSGAHASAALCLHAYLKRMSSLVPRTDQHYHAFAWSSMRARRKRP